MSEKFRNKYRIASHRKPFWDYSADALYFLTIVTQNRDCVLGEIVASPVETHGRASLHDYHAETHGRAFQRQPSYKMELSDFGKIVEQELFKSFEIRQELILHEYVIMPNHIHAIVEINNTDIAVQTHGRASLHDETHDRAFRHADIGDIGDYAETHDRASLRAETLSIKRNPPKRMPQSISSFLAGFKSAVNTKIDDYIDQHQLEIPKYNRKNHFFQPNYHDHIIRNHLEYLNISQYILHNPQNWHKDKFKGTS